ncbi:hypothetical protein BDN72DRAFT_838593 [Pluteus cervinus]|uniref:Uncharacterized protein n=1 Tax=Pluteus cervinus TaxID=181527 RepID=A0ACD3AYE4_9AGAR|nr:hypothetical protein BDN72DRAFT_838593 [Pluteus cervinus]
MAPTLMCLSSYIHADVSSLLYRELVVYTDAYVKEPSEEAIKRYGHHIRHLLLGWRLDVSQATGMLPIYLRSSPNIIHLGICVAVEAEDEWLDHLKKLPLIRLTLHPSSLGMDYWDHGSAVSSVHSRLSCFTQLTHLNIAGVFPLPYISCFRALPNLTSLSMYCEHLPLGWNFPDLRSEHPGIKAFIIVREDSEIDVYMECDEDLGCIKDPRAISCLVPDYIADWRRGARGLLDLHDFAWEKLNERGHG